MRQVMLGVLVGLVAVLSACDSGTSGPQTAEQQGCEQFVDAFCARTVACATNAGQSATTQQCKSLFRQQVDCRDAVQLGSGFEQCLDAIPNVDCDMLLAGDPDTLPSSCDAVILTN